MIEYFYNILSFDGGETGFSARIGLVADNVIYAAHFPGHPVTPGACQLEMVRAVASHAAGRNLEIETVRELKFLKPVDPLATGVLLLEGEMQVEDGGTLHCFASFSEGEAVLTKVSMCFKQ